MKNLIEGCKIIELPNISDPKGNLVFCEALNHIPFEIKRVYFIGNIPVDAVRAGHSHKDLERVIIAASGSFKILLDNGLHQVSVTLDSPRKGLYIPKMIWCEISRFSDHSVCLVLASDFYKESDYCRNYEDFKKSVFSEFK